MGGGTGSNTGLGTRALFFAGLGPDYKNEISHITISTLGNDQDFGDSTASKQAAGGFSSRTRGFSVGGMNNSSQFIDVIEFATFASLGDATDFGNLTGTKNRPAGVSDQTRGVSGGGNPNTNVIDYVTMSSAGDAQDFGDLSAARQSINSFASSTRGVFAGGYVEPADVNTIDFITISSTYRLIGAVET